MEFLKRDWKRRTLIVLAISTVLSLAMWGFELTDYAAQLNSAGPHVEEGPGGSGGQRPPAVLMFILPFVKWTVLTLVPAAIVIGIRKLYRKLAG